MLSSARRLLRVRAGALVVTRNVTGGEQAEWSTVPSSQLRHVEELVDYLNDNILDPDDNVTTLDLLDVLASIGARLVSDEDGVSATDYWSRLPAPAE